MQGRVDKLEGLAAAEKERIHSLQHERLDLETNLEIPIPLKMGQVGDVQVARAAGHECVLMIVDGQADFRVLLQLPHAALAYGQRACA